MIFGQIRESLLPRKFPAIRQLNNHMTLCQRLTLVELLQVLQDITNERGQEVVGKSLEIGKQSYDILCQRLTLVELLQALQDITNEMEKQSVSRLKQLNNDILCQRLTLVELLQAFQDITNQTEEKQLISCLKQLNNHMTFCVRA